MLYGLNIIKKEISSQLKSPFPLLCYKVGKHSLPLSRSFDEPKMARCRSPFFNGSSILGLAQNKPQKNTDFYPFSRVNSLVIIRK
jgi:hypothetical protein